MTRSAKRICIVSQYWEPDPGNTIRLRHCINVLKRKGFAITLITTIPHYPEGDHKGFGRKLMSFEIQDGLRVLRVWMPGIPHRGFGRRILLVTWFSFLAIMPTVILGNVDYVWCFDQRIFSTFVGLPCRFFWGSKIVSDVTDVWPEALVNTGYTQSTSVVFRIGRFLGRIAYRMSDKITTLTDGMKEMLRTTYGVPANRLYTVPIIAPRAWQNALRFVPPFTILFWGNLGTNYDFAVVLELAKQLEGAGVQFSVIGRGESANQIIDEVRKMHLTNVHINTRFLPRETLSRLAGSAGAFVLGVRDGPFKDASLPGKFFDYLQMGRPIIYIGRGYEADLVDKYSLGVSVTNSEIRKAVEFVHQLLQEPKTIEAFAERSRGLIETVFPEENLQPALLAVFD